MERTYTMQIKQIHSYIARLLISSHFHRKMMLVLFFFLLFPVPLASASLRVGFYSHTCPRAESIVRAVVQKRFQSDRSITAALLRMYFHDCFVRGCDASILINSTKKKPSEKTTGPNLTVRGFSLIDAAKSRLESECPSTVSCADIIALATRDAVALAGGPRYAVPTGRRDGRVSNPADIILPGPALTVEQAARVFAFKGLSRRDMVVLLGAHTVGLAHCGFFRDRLFDFQGTGRPDPTMEPRLRGRLIKPCGKTQRPGSKDPAAFLDQGSSFLVDNQYYEQIAGHRGVLLFDQELALDNSTAGIVAGLRRDEQGFVNKFGDSLVRLGEVHVLEGKAGEIRKRCGAVN